MAYVDVLDFNGVKDRWLVYKHPNNEFNNKSKIVVKVGQAAVIVHGGKVEKIVENGTYELETLNLPFLKNLQKKVYGGKTPFQMDVYYINKVIKLDMLWGTNDAIKILDPKFNIFINLRARAQYGLRITNYQFLITQLVGTIGERLLTFDIVNNFFRGLLNSKIKTFLTTEIKDKNISIIDINTSLDSLSSSTTELLRPEFENFGMDLVNFYYESINVPDEDLAMINQILTKNAEFNILGEDRYRTVRGYDILDSAAKNEGSGGNIAAAGVGLGLGLGVAKEASNMSSDLTNDKRNICYNCNKEMDKGVKFCPSCGAKQDLKCSDCNSPIKPGTKFCPSCGAKVGGQE